MIIRIRIRPILKRRECGANFVHPMDPTPRTVVLTPGFRETKLVRVFASGWDDRAARFQPTSVAGSVDQLRPLTRAGLRLEHAVIVFTRGGEGELLHDDREFLWRAFGVPVYEQFLDDNNDLLATECEVHSGLHILSGCEGQAMDSEKCGCGNLAPRLSRGARIEELVELIA
jgi:hypothetical protein